MHSHTTQPRNRQTIGSGQRLRRPAQALDRRTHPRLAWPLPQTGQGLGMPQPQGARLPPPRLHPPHATKAMQSRMMFPDRTLRLLDRASGRYLVNLRIGIDRVVGERVNAPQGNVFRRLARLVYASERSRVGARLRRAGTSPTRYVGRGGADVRAAAAGWGVSARRDTCAAAGCQRQVRRAQRQRKDERRAGQQGAARGLQDGRT